MQEQWAPIPGHEGVYDVSDQGRVRSWLRWGQPKGTARLMTPSVNSAGYYTVALRGSTSSLVHHLVAAAFLGPRPDGLFVCHGDGNKLNNRLTNLSYETPARNQQDRVRHGAHENARKTHCPRNHAYSPENTYRAPSRPRQRQCRTCKREAKAAPLAASIPTNRVPRGKT